jgi:hypothetical protein
LRAALVIVCSSAVVPLQVTPRAGYPGRGCGIPIAVAVSGDGPGYLTDDRRLPGGAPDLPVRRDLAEELEQAFASRCVEVSRQRAAAATLVGALLLALLLRGLARSRAARVAPET